jgi:hypothetical protein
MVWTNGTITPMFRPAAIFALRTAAAQWIAQAGVTLFRRVAPAA